MTTDTTTDTTAPTNDVTRFLGLQVVLGLDNDPEGRTATVHYEHNGTCGVVGYPDRDNQQLVRAAALYLRQVADAVEAQANDDSRWPAPYTLHMMHTTEADETVN